ncbi:MAG: S9 family peptidase, partial [Actinobacteria bacterium]|nr:S9 family peptidase [Actinomycetota bacterium]
MNEQVMYPWERRFRAPVTSMPDWSPQAPNRVVYASNESGVWQLRAWDRVSGLRRQVTDHPVGVTDGTPTLDGSGVLW